MALTMRGLARRLAACFDLVSAAARRDPHGRSDDRERLATELLATLSPQVLAQTGHWRRMAPAAVAARKRDH